MSKAYWKDVSAAAADLVRQDPPVPYSQLDCQAFVEACVTQAGGEMDYRGSNHMLREACGMVMPLEKAQKSGLLHSGCLLFIVEPVNDKTPAPYRADGLGDASHVGLYIDMHHLESGAYIQVAHSSASRGMVCASTLQNAWTHVGWAKCIEYEPEVEAVVSGGPGAVASEAAVDAARIAQASQTAALPRPTAVRIAASSLNMRKSPGTKGAYILKIPQDEIIAVFERKTVGGKAWGRTEYANHNGNYAGWVDLSFTQEVVS